MRCRSFCLFALVLGLLEAGAFAGQRKIEFNRDVRPILSNQCFKCHGFDAKERKADRRLDTPEGAYAEIEKVRAMFGGLADLPDSSADFNADMNIWEISFAKGDPEQVRNDMYSGKPVDYMTVVLNAKTFELRYMNQVRSGCS